MSNSVQEVSQSSLSAENSATLGNEIVSQSVEQMNYIDTSSNAMKEIIQVLGQKSEQIGNVISIITTIAEQTNLLALNAAIEAARAGEHGRGFAVVAEEVRKLAEESSQSGGKVNELIKDIQQEIRKTVEAMGENNQAIEKGITLANQAGKAFEEITIEVDDVSNQIQRISIAIQQINTKMATLFQSSKDTEEIVKETEAHAQNVAASAEEQHAAMEEISSASITLSKMAEDLQSIVTKFKL
ncbi:methyl-accepting chemotaxis protein [Ammoniphilus resinae]